MSAAGVFPASPGIAPFGLRTWRGVVAGNERPSKKGSLSELAGAGAHGMPASPINIFWGCLAGLLWYLQFIFYGMGHNRMDTLGVASWPLQLFMLILFSTLVAIIRREWSDCSPATKRFISIAIGILVLAVLVIGYGNHLNQAIVSMLSVMAISCAAPTTMSAGVLTAMRRTC